MTGNIWWFYLGFLCVIFTDIAIKIKDLKARVSNLFDRSRPHFQIDKEPATL